MSKYRINELEEYAALFKALSNPQRLKILMKLAAACASGSCCSGAVDSMRRCVGEVGDDLGICASTVSHHLKELRQAGLIEVERCGQKIECWVSPAVMKRLSEFLESASGGVRGKEGPNG